MGKTVYHVILIWSSIMTLSNYKAIHGIMVERSTLCRKICQATDLDCYYYFAIYFWPFVFLGEAIHESANWIGAHRRQNAYTSKVRHCF